MNTDTPAPAEQAQDGGSAFPHDNQELGDKHRSAMPGMTLRDYFAAKVMHAVLNGLIAGSEGPTSLDEISHLGMRSYDMADAMLRARATKGAA